VKDRGGGGATFSATAGAAHTQTTQDGHRSSAERGRHQLMPDAWCGGP
jgi:hypothetical protein